MRVCCTVQAAATLTPADLSSLQAALNLYAADFLAGFTLPDCPDFDDWQAFQAESLRRGLRALLEKLAWAWAAAGEDARTIAVAQRWLAQDPLDDGAHRALMQTYARSGQQAAALRQYERCAEILNIEMGVTAVWERGASLDLDIVVVQLLAELATTRTDRPRWRRERTIIHDPFQLLLPIGC